MNAQEDIELRNLRVKMYGSATNESEPADEAEPHGEDKIGSAADKLLQQRRQGILYGNWKVGRGDCSTHKKSLRNFPGGKRVRDSEAFSYCYEEEKTVAVGHQKGWAMQKQRGG